MDRRYVVRALGVLGVGSIIPSSELWPSVARPQNVPDAKHDTSKLPAVVAGISIVDSSIARKAVELCRDSSAPYLFNHTVRTFIFASLTGRASSQRFDEEQLFLACILHNRG